MCEHRTSADPAFRMRQRDRRTTLTPIEHPVSCPKAWCLFPALTICQCRICRCVPFACTFVSPAQYAVVNLTYFPRLWRGKWRTRHTSKLRHVKMCRPQYCMISEKSMWYRTVLHAPGVPSKMTVPGTLCFSRAARRARATATPAIAIRLCSQPCPIPRSCTHFRVHSDDPSDVSCTAPKFCARMESVLTWYYGPFFIKFFSLPHLRIHDDGHSKEKYSKGSSGTLRWGPVILLQIVL